MNLKLEKKLKFRRLINKLCRIFVDLKNYGVYRRAISYFIKLSLTKRRVLFFPQKRFLYKILISSLVFLWFFSSWPQIWQNPSGKQEVKYAEAASIKNFENKNINFSFTDDNSDEDLIIKTDQESYIGLSQAEFYFSVANMGDKSEQVNLQVYFPEDRGEVKTIEKLTTNVPYEIDVPEYGPKEYFCEDGWEKITEEAIVDEPIISYQCPSSNETTFCESLSEDGKNCTLNKVEIGSHKETKYRDEWRETTLSKDPIKIAKTIQKKPVSNKFKVKKSTSQNYLINPGQTEYFRAEINFPPSTSGEFYIEAIGDKKGYGLLDPGWISGWNYRKQITLSAGSGAGTNYQVKLLVGESSSAVGANFHLEGHGKNDFSDLRFTDDDESTELNYWIESISGTTPTQTATVWVKVRDDLSSAGTIYAYYGNSGAPTVSNGSNTFIFFDDFSGDLSKWTKEVQLGTITLTGGYVECGGGVTSGNYGHTVLGSSATYTGFQDGIIEFRHYHATNGIGEVSFRGNYAGNTGYKGRWDARSGSEQVFLKPPYSGWANIGAAITKWITTSTWYKGKLVIHGSTLELYDNDSLKQSMTDTTYSSAGEISLQNHYGSYSRYDDVRVRKYASTEPTFNSAGNEQTSGSISVDIVDASYASVTSPSMAMSSTTFGLTCQTITGSFGTATQQIYVNNNNGANSGWILNVAAQAITNVWDSTGTDYDFNDPTSSGCIDGGDAGDSVGGQMTIDPSNATLAVGQCGSCTTNYISKGSSSAFNEGVTNTITLLTATSNSDNVGDWTLNGVTISQTIPKEQPVASDYNINMILTIIAN